MMNENNRRFNDETAVFYLLICVGFGLQNCGDNMRLNFPFSPLNEDQMVTSFDDLKRRRQGASERVQSS